MFLAGNAWFGREWTWSTATNERRACATPATTARGRLIQQVCCSVKYQLLSRKQYSKQNNGFYYINMPLLLAFVMYRVL